MRHLLVATRNAHKTGEIRALLGPAWRVDDLGAHPDLPEVDETEPTFSGNAALKALSASRRLAGVWVLADDSGLEVDALDGAPGVISARYSGPGATDASNRAKLLAALREVPADRRAARFRCAMALARDGRVEGEFDGRVEGRILFEERGQGGFGYDRLFAPAGHERTFGELSAEVKNTLSHRARALEQAVAFLGRAGE
ncbi:MAG: RdgB/HAM1 family non-canonical purine NTP pyrophosphatase [Verrucomicrobia bacterium]|nr:RdgB/HAM1 family non-canonical purine NTP pyrophosphatase [Verrucomicrobiota bacterium]